MYVTKLPYKHTQAYGQRFIDGGPALSVEEQKSLLDQVRAGDFYFF